MELLKNISDLRFRCSGLSHLMKEPRSKSEVYSETLKTHAVDMYVRAMFGRKEEKVSKYLEKGNEREEDAITLFSRISKKPYFKNNKILRDDFISGEPDLFDGEDIYRAEETIDTKVSWSLFTFMRSAVSPLIDAYIWQGHGYMALTNAKKHTVVYCLINGTAEHIDREKRNLAYRCEVDSPRYNELCKQIEINHIFDIAAFKKENPRFIFHNDIRAWQYDIPMERRIYKHEMLRDESAIEKIANKVRLARQYLEENINNLFVNENGKQEQPAATAAVSE